MSTKKAKHLSNEALSNTGTPLFAFSVLFLMSSQGFVLGDTRQKCSRPASDTEEADARHLGVGREDHGAGACSPLGSRTPPEMTHSFKYYQNCKTSATCIRLIDEPCKVRYKFYVKISRNSVENSDKFLRTICIKKTLHG